MTGKELASHQEAELRQAAPRPFVRENLLLGLGLLLAPVAWAVHFALSYGLVYPAERWQSKAALHWVALLAALLCLSSVGLGWRGLRHSHLGGAMNAAERERSRFLSAGACVAGIFFLLAVAAQCVPAFMLELGRRP